MEEQFYISTDKSKLDVPMIHEYLAHRSYWAKGRTKAVLETVIQHSICFGVYNSAHRQVGFARILTDHAVLAWIFDVFILEPWRGRGLGKLLVKTILDHPDLQGIKAWRLNTSDAHGLYRQFGFREVANFDFHMEKVDATL